jgi:hypothetical protein
VNNVTHSVYTIALIRMVAIAIILIMYAIEDNALLVIERGLRQLVPVRKDVCN